MAKIKRSQACPKLHLHNRQKDVSIPAKAVRHIVEELFSYLGISQTEMSLYFVSKREIARLHDQFFQDPSPTDCMSFPLEDPVHLGEIFVCPKVAIEFVEKNGGNIKEEIVLYIVHGILHLIGHEDLDPKPRRKMRKEEKRCLQHLQDRKLLW